MSDSALSRPAGGASSSGTFETEVRQFVPASSVFVLLLFLALPFILGDFDLNFLTGVLVYCILALSLDLDWGYGGIISLAQGTFFGVGAYAMAYALLHGGHIQGVLIGLGVGVALAGLVGLAVGVISFRARVSGLYFAILTLALAVAAELAANTLAVTGGSDGLYGVPGIGTMASLGSNATMVQYYVVLAVTLVVFGLAWVFVHSRFGKVLMAARENELRATSIGYSVNTAKAVTFGAGAALAALAGALYAPYSGIISPDGIGFATGANVLIWVAIGGRGYLVGAVIGTFILNYAQFKLTNVVAVFSGTAKANDVWPVVFGVVFLLVVLVFPNGIAGGFARIGNWKIRLNRRVPVPWVRWKRVEPSSDESNPNHLTEVAT